MSALGLPTCLAEVATLALVCLMGRRSPLKLAASVSWGVLPLIAGLFVLVEALDRTAVTGMLAGALQPAAAKDVTLAGAGTILAFACNLLNNLPAGLIATILWLTAIRREG